MNKVIEKAKTIIISLISYEVASKKFGFRLYSKKFIDNQVNRYTHI